MTETPAAQKRGSFSAPGICAANSAGKGAVNDRQVRAHLLEQAAVQHRHPPAAARRAAGVGALPGLEREPAGLADGRRRPRTRAPSASIASMIRRWMVAKPVARADASARRRPSAPKSFMALVSPRTRATRRSTCPTGVSGRTPWPRLKIWARGAANPSRTRSISSSRRGPPATSASGSRLPCKREPPGQRGDGGLRLDGRVEADRVDVGDSGRISSVGSRRRAEKR